MTDAGLSPGDAARRLGIAVTTLRSWHRRYGLGPTDTAPGRHRRYAELDMSRLETMRQLTSEGIPAAQAARLALTASSARPTRGPSRPGGGNAIPVGRHNPAARGLGRAAMRLDAPAMTDILTDSLREQGVLATWDGLLRPVLRGLAQRQRDDGHLVEVEHVLSRTISEALATVPRPPSGAPVRTLLACANEEQHSLPLEALAAALAEAGVGCRQLGARVPPDALRAAVRRTGPNAVVVWSQTAETSNPEQLATLLAARPRPVVVAAAGPGWHPGSLALAISRPASLADALQLIVSATRAS